MDDSRLFSENFLQLMRRSLPFLKLRLFRSRLRLYMAILKQMQGAVASKTVAKKKENLHNVSQMLFLMCKTHAPGVA